MLLDRATRPGSRQRWALGEEARALTDIGNKHRIRPSEIEQEPLETTAQLDYVFLRLFSSICRSRRAGDWDDPASAPSQVFLHGLPALVPALFHAPPERKQN